MNNWFNDIMIECKKDSRFHAECALMDVTERICKLYGQPKGIYGILFWLLNWSADKLIWRKQSPKPIITETGTWKAIKDDTRVVIQSNDFTHDVMLIVDGDFKDIDQKLEYAEEIARRLNKASR